MAYATVEQSRVLMLKAAILTDLQRLQKKTINVYNYYDPPIDISVIIMIQIQMEIDLLPNIVRLLDLLSQ